jgi:hypothetical protein
MKKAGLVVLVLGVILTIFTAFTFFTREKIVDIGSLKITANKPHHLRWSPLVGVAVMGAGGIMIFIGSKK